MKTTVRHAKGSYQVEATTVRAVLDSIRPSDLVVTDKSVKRALKIEDDCFAIEPGEESKSLPSYGALMEWLAQRGHRGSRIVAIGGGVVGDLAGFAAATFLRGVEIVQVPTSLMAMVDSSVGGKVGIDLASGKNLIGSFWQPASVQVPIDALMTLPERHFTNGTAEVWKYACIMDHELYKELSSAPLIPGTAALSGLIFRCIEHKRQVVEEDEFERTGRRAILNFGHTVGHAIEQCQRYSGLLHGESISVGMVVETQIAEDLGFAEVGTAEQIESRLVAQGLPVSFPNDVSLENLLLTMSRDKKSDGNGLAFSFVSTIGECKLTAGVPVNDVENALRKRWP